jgi:hypothetical protein
LSSGDPFRYWWHSHTSTNTISTGDNVQVITYSSRPGYEPYSYTRPEWLHAFDIESIPEPKKKRGPWVQEIKGVNI